MDLFRRYIAAYYLVEMHDIHGLFFCYLIFRGMCIRIANDVV